MFNFFEHPWTLIGLAVLVLFGVFTYRSVWPEKRAPWQWFLPLVFATVGPGLDALVKTDLEKITALLKTSIQAVQQEDINTISSILAEDYQDSQHNTKADLMRTCSSKFAQSLVEKCKKTNSRIEPISGPTALATVFATIHFDKNSYVAQNYKAWMMVKVQLHFKKQPDKSWLINRAEILEIDRQPVKWRQI